MRSTLLAALLAVCTLPTPVLACPAFPGPEAEMAGGPFAYTVMERPQPVPQPKRHVAVPNGDLSTVKVTLQRTQCYGTCPSYTLEFSGDGSARYHGEAHVLVPGDHAFRVSSEDVRCLVEGFRAIDFWSLAPVYRAPITDLPTYFVTLQIGGRTKRVEDYAGQVVGMPKEVAALEAAIDRLAGDRWTKGDGTTLNALRNEGFDFHSRAAASMVALAADFAPDDVAIGLLDAGAPATGHLPASWDGGLPGPTAVEVASAKGRLPVVRALIAHGAFAPGGQAAAALLASARNGHPDVLEVVLTYHPDLRAFDSETETALMVASAGFNADEKDANPIQAKIVRLLLAAGADPKVRDNHGRTALHFMSSPEATALLIKAGADINAIDQDGQTPLLAARSDEQALTLLQAGADASIKSSDGASIEAKASQEKWVKTLAWLSAHHAWIAAEARFARGP